MMRTQMLSLAFFQNRATRFIYFFISPLINVAFLILLNTGVDKRATIAIALGSVMYSGAILSLNSMLNLLVMDLTLHIDREVMARSPYSTRYWLAKVIISYLSGTMLVLINLFFLVMFGVPVAEALHALVGSLLMCSSGVVLGITSYAVSRSLSNPYFLSNIIASFGIVLAAVVVPLERSPKWIEAMSYILPFARTVEFGTGRGDVAGVVTDELIVLIWLFAGAIAYNYQIRQTRISGRYWM